jgi:hypothetical protein
MSPELVAGLTVDKMESKPMMRPVGGGWRPVFSRPSAGHTGVLRPGAPEFYSRTTNKEERSWL